ncbi:hypothetical protein [Hydrogenophaga palleronii]|uniref:hypothetical protein n=1 Tax=Hydrogenophaga palleronii TaxID=65655 RepID=UPI000A4D5852|nr:hypothetical protein [Hydrogenophaga palleronii]
MQTAPPTAPSSALMAPHWWPHPARAIAQQAGFQWAHTPGVPQPTPEVPPVPPEISPDIDEPEFPDTPTPPVQDPPPQPQPIIGRA